MAFEQFTSTKDLIETTDEFENRKIYIAVLTEIANIHYAKNELQTAVEFATKASELSRKVGGEDSIFHLARAQNLALFLCQNKEHQKSEEVFARIIPLLEKQLGNNSIDYQKTIHDRAVNLIRFEKADLAVDLWTKLAEIQANSIGKSHPDYATTLESLVDAYQRTGQLDLADSRKAELAKIKEAWAAQAESKASTSRQGGQPKTDQ